jgi:hypothetical protein
MLAILLMGHAAHASQLLNSQIEGLEAEYQSLIPPTHNMSSKWTPPLLDGDSHLFSWRVLVTTDSLGMSVARNVTQINATLTLTTAGSAPIVCHPNKGSDLSLMCGSSSLWKFGSKYIATLDVELEMFVGTGMPPVATHATLQGWFVRGLGRSSSWGGAEWIGLSDANDTAAQFRSMASIHDLGFVEANDIVQVGGTRMLYIICTLFALLTTTPYPW